MALAVLPWTRMTMPAEKALQLPPSVRVIVREEALKLKNSKTMNMIVLGAVLERTNVVTVESVLQALRKVLPERYHNLLPLNEQALRRGMQLAAELQPA